MSFNMDIELDADSFIEWLDSDQEETLNILAEKILRKRKEEKPEEFFSAKQWERIIGEFMPETLDMDELIEIIYKSTKGSMENEIEYYKGEIK